MTVLFILMPCLVVRTESTQMDSVLTQNPDNSLLTHGPLYWGGPRRASLPSRNMSCWSSPVGPNPKPVIGFGDVPANQNDAERNSIKRSVRALQCARFSLIREIKKEQNGKKRPVCDWTEDVGKQASGRRQCSLHCRKRASSTAGTSA